MPQIKVYHATDGKLTVRMPKGTIPDRATIERLADAIRAEKESPAPCCNTEQGSVDETSVAKTQLEDTSSAALCQETMEIISQLPAEDVEEITRFARDLIKGRA